MEIQLVFASSTVDQMQEHRSAIPAVKKKKTMPNSAKFHS